MAEQVEQVFGVAAQGAGRGGDVRAAESGADHTDGDVAQGRHHLGCGAGAELGPVFIEGCVADVVDGVVG